MTRKMPKEKVKCSPVQPSPVHYNIHLISSNPDQSNRTGVNTIHLFQSSPFKSSSVHFVSMVLIEYIPSQFNAIQSDPIPRKRKEKKREQKRRERAVQEI